MISLASYIALSPHPMRQRSGPFASSMVWTPFEVCEVIKLFPVPRDLLREADTQSELICIARRIIGGAEEHAIVLIVVIQKGHKEAAGLTMLTNDVFFFVFAILKYFNHFGWSKQPLSYSREM